MLNFSELEENILKKWQEDKTFEKSLEKRKDAPHFVFYEGPPTANGRPGIHHVLARAYKDIICRYKTMAGFFVARKAGWDTHGLPVELEVEKKLGLKSKKEIETYGIAAFNKKCKESVWTYKEEWEKLTQRIGFWLDMEHPYVTYEPAYMETLFGIIKQIWEKGLLYRGNKVVPYCARCGTGLSSHEVAQGYKEVTENSVYVKFKLKPGQKFGAYTTKDSAYILSWTTTPWTLPGNVALAVGEKIRYAALRIKDVPELYIIASDLVPSVFKDQSIEVVHDDIFGKDLVGLSYEPFFDIPALNTEVAYKIYAVDFVTTTDGTGVVHTAVMYGEDDYNLGVAVGLPQHHTVDLQGKFTDEVKGLEGLYVKDKKTEAKIIDYLKEGGWLLAEKPYTHDYPFCWRCDSPLLYYAKPSWFIAMSKLREKLIENNNTVTWVPAHMKEGRFGEWLKEVKDWNFSRERYWGTPLPIWECETCKAQDCVGSIEELDARAYEKSGNVYILMRHGEADSNMNRVISDRAENSSHLTERGRSMAHAAAKKLKESGGADCIYSSDFSRTKETAGIMGEELGVLVEYDKRLWELNHGKDFDGKAVEEYVEHYTSKGLNRFDYTVEGGETWADLRRRMMAFIADTEKRHKGKKILVVGHGDPLWVLERALAGFYDADFREANIQAAGRPEYPTFADPKEVRVRALPYDDDGCVNLHRPYIDEFFLKCKKQDCNGKMVRVKDLVDVWFDSGSMPFAQDASSASFPISYKLKAKSSLEFPADYICEAIDQTRGWFYTLLAVSTLLEKGAPYRNVISLSHVLDAKGQKMSKSRGNAADPWDVMAKYGADALRWYFFTVNDPGDSKLFDEKHVQERMRGFLGTLWNCVVFWKTYSKKQITNNKKQESPDHVLDRWVLSMLNKLVGDIRRKLDAYDVTGAARSIERFAVDDLSQWYVRRSRQRLQENAQSMAIFRHILETIAKLMASFVPFVAEAAWQELGGDSSVHLENFPAEGLSEEKMLYGMEVLRSEVTVGLGQRAAHGIKIRQPLQSFTSVAWEKALKSFSDVEQKELTALLAEELNVKEVLFGKEAVLDAHITQALKLEGDVREFIRQIQDARKKAGLKPGEEIVLTVGDEESKKLLEHPVYGHAICAKTSVKSWSYQPDAPFDISRGE